MSGPDYEKLREERQRRKANLKLNAMEAVVKGMSDSLEVRSRTAAMFFGIQLIERKLKIHVHPENDRREEDQTHLRQTD